MRQLLTDADRIELAKRRLSEEEFDRQSRLLEDGPHYVELLRPCTIGDGIQRLDESAGDRHWLLFVDAAASGSLMRFVPASGAATRMFRDLRVWLDLLESGDEMDFEGPLRERVDSFFHRLDEFAIYGPLARYAEKRGIDLETLRRKDDRLRMLRLLLDEGEMNCSALPKGLLAFHRYDGGEIRTAFEEHLMESSRLFTDSENRCRLHFTISPEHRGSFTAHADEVLPKWESRIGVHFDVGFTEQSPTTETLAMTRDGRLLRDARDRLVFRPGGHGSLLGNLNGLDEHIVSLQNIDNVARDRFKGVSIAWKQQLIGFFLQLQGRVFDYCRLLSDSVSSAETLMEIRDFIVSTFGHAEALQSGAFETMSVERKRHILLTSLHRPLRVCGMVINVSAPGGGPFWVRDSRGESVQIVEKAEIDESSVTQQAILAASTHFNPVDIVCGLHDFRGDRFDLTAFSDPQRCFLTEKTWQGQTILALEHPGLWNGGMAHWNTVFVEAPSATFQPVKTLFDLLLREHLLG